MGRAAVYHDKREPVRAPARFHAPRDFVALEPPETDSEEDSYGDLRRRRTPYSCQINPTKKTSKTVNTMRPKPCVYENR